MEKRRILAEIESTFHMIEGMTWGDSEMAKRDGTF